MKNRCLNVIILFIITIQTTSLSFAQCSITSMGASYGSCNPSTNLFQLSGTVSFINKPTTGSLIITDCQGNADTLYPPFTSPSSFSFQANSTGNQNCFITAVFTADTNCIDTLNPLNYPASCVCNANVGTFNINLSGQSTTNYTLCYGDVIEITPNGDMIPPYETLSPPISDWYPSAEYRPGIGFAIYSCPPTIFPQDDFTSDPCLAGIFSVNNFRDSNSLGEPIIPAMNNTVYIVPITVYDKVELIYSYTNVGSNCYSMGNPIAVQYLPEIIDSNAQENNIDSTFSVEIYGGLPKLNGSLFSADNLIPSTAYFVNNTTNHGGTITIGGLLDGDVYSFSVSDSTGCEVVISGGPYIGLSFTPCSTVNFTSNTSSCNPATNLFELTGTIEYNDPPSSGYLTITDCNGNSDTLFPPFISPSVFSIQLNSTGIQNCSLTAAFSADSTCLSVIYSDYPDTCLCIADVGTFTSTITGLSTTNHILCYGDIIEISSDGNMIPSYEALNPPITTIDTSYAYRPGIGYLVYSCLPTILPQNDYNADTCFSGITIFGNLTDTNNLGEPNWGFPTINNTVYFVPITFYDTLSEVFSYTNNGLNCYFMGNPISVQYLSAIVASNAQENNIDSTFSVTINGGLPEIDSSLYTADNLLPASAYFINTNKQIGTDIKVGGLLNNDMYSFRVSDNNGSELIISGGPYVGLPVGTSEMIDNYDFTVYPNPIKDEFTVEFTNTKQNNLTIEIYSVLGKKVLEKHIEISSSNRIFNLNLEDEANGVYFLKIISKNNSLTKQILKN
ncbi:MAG: hypothetical protein KFKLKKLM_01176 [Flavobacteriales bacterium]|nr:hypothetical protein [Flavobacteriales bacterium]